MSNEPSNNPAAFEPSAQEQALNGQFKKILLLFGVIVAGLAAYGIIQHNARTAAEAAAEAFTGAKTVDDCDLVVKKHPGTPAAANALLLKATLHWEKNEKKMRIDHWVKNLLWSKIFRFCSNFNNKIYFFLLSNFRENAQFRNSIK